MAATRINAGLVIAPPKPLAPDNEERRVRTVWKLSARNMTQPKITNAIVKSHAIAPGKGLFSDCQARHVTKPTPCQRPQAIKVQPAPCQRPQRAMLPKVAITYWVRPFRLPPIGM